MNEFIKLLKSRQEFIYNLVCEDLGFELGSKNRPNIPTEKLISFNTLGQWKYEFHGIGLRAENESTGEIIDFDLDSENSDPLCPYRAYDYFLNYKTINPDAKFKLPNDRDLFLTKLEAFQGLKSQPS